MVATSLERQGNGSPRFRGCTNIRDFEFLGKLGEGTFGEVYKARSKRDNTIVALKKILMHNERDGFPITALREIKLLKMLSHTNILHLREMAVERSKGEGRKKPSMYMVTPYMEHDLSGLLENPSVRFTEAQIKCYMLQLLEGLKYLHANSILHRDMKAANLLISNKGVLQIADFGLARPYEEPPPQPGKGGGEAKRDYTTLVVTRWYRPPELLLQLRRYTTAIDMWGVGCVFGEMFKGKPILAGNSDLNQAHLIFNLVGSPTEETMPGWSLLPGCDGVKSFGNRPGRLSEVFRDQSSNAVSLLRELLRLDWKKRINAIDALNHPYFADPPLPARPGELPSFEDSHELDRRRFRSNRAVMPPAPTGGSIAMATNGSWTTASGIRPPVAENKSSRLPSAVRSSRPHPSAGHGHSQARSSDNRLAESHTSQARLDEESHSGPWRRGGLPPKPPASAHQWHSGNMGRIGRERDHNRAVDYSRERDNNINLSTDRHDQSRESHSRRRSRSPLARDGARDTDRAFYRR